LVARYTGASLGLLAFAVAITGGLLAQNPVTVTLSRGILALFLFFLLGIALGTAAQYVLSEYEGQRMSQLGGPHREEDPAGAKDAPPTSPGGDKEAAAKG
jgi:hypothetical protein